MRSIIFGESRRGMFAITVFCLTVVLLGLGTLGSQASEGDHLLVAVSSIGNTLDSAIANFTNT